MVWAAEGLYELKKLPIDLAKDQLLILILFLRLNVYPIPN